METDNRKDRCVEDWCREVYRVSGGYDIRSVWVWRDGVLFQN